MSPLPAMRCAWSNTPLDFATHHEYQRMIELLSPHSRDVWNLTSLGDVDRLREILPAEPRLAKVSWGTSDFLRSFIPSEPLNASHSPQPRAGQDQHIQRTLVKADIETCR